MTTGHPRHRPTRHQPAGPTGRRPGRGACWVCCAFSYAAGQALADHYGLTGAASAALLACSALAGLMVAYGLMVAARRFIAPPCA
ncbi:hypothetical protein [Streptomyces solincola]|uniref:hypothetical protein n=1 Tax=Streptomyces solincola TaxID=2100817 RepID=UPI0011B2305D|nr:hypothetical protein [Streptomyces solincola]